MEKQILRNVFSTNYESDLRPPANLVAKLHRFTASATNNDYNDLANAVSALAEKCQNPIYKDDILAIENDVK